MGSNNLIMCLCERSQIHVEQKDEKTLKNLQKTELTACETWIYHFSTFFPVCGYSSGESGYSSYKSKGMKN